MSSPWLAATATTELGPSPLSPPDRLSVDKITVKIFIDASIASPLKSRLALASNSPRYILHSFDVEVLAQEDAAAHWFAADDQTRLWHTWLYEDARTTPAAAAAMITDTTQTPPRALFTFSEAYNVSAATVLTKIAASCGCPSSWTLTLDVPADETPTPHSPWDLDRVLATRSPHHERPLSIAEFLCMAAPERLHAFFHLQASRIATPYAAVPHSGRFFGHRSPRSLLGGASVADSPIIEKPQSCVLDRMAYAPEKARILPDTILIQDYNLVLRHVKQWSEQIVAEASHSVRHFFGRLIGAGRLVGTSQTGIPLPVIPSDDSNNMVPLQPHLHHAFDLDHFYICETAARPVFLAPRRLPSEIILAQAARSRFPELEHRLGSSHQRTIPALFAKGCHTVWKMLASPEFRAHLFDLAGSLVDEPSLEHAGSPRRPPDPEDYAQGAIRRAAENYDQITGGSVRPSVDTISEGCSGTPLTARAAQRPSAQGREHRDQTREGRDRRRNYPPADEDGKGIGIYMSWWVRTAGKGYYSSSGCRQRQATAEIAAVAAQFDHCRLHLDPRDRFVWLQSLASSTEADDRADFAAACAKASGYDRIRYLLGFASASSAAPINEVMLSILSPGRDADSSAQSDDRHPCEDGEAFGADVFDALYRQCETLAFYMVWPLLLIGYEFPSNRIDADSKGSGADASATEADTPIATSDPIRPDPAPSI